MFQGLVGVGGLRQFRIRWSLDVTAFAIQWCDFGVGWNWGWGFETWERFGEH